MKGKVYVVGAGPGAADLLTLKAAAALASAGVVLHDDLVSQEVLSLAARNAEIINVGKRCGRHRTTQQEINQLMVSCARRGKTVVRLKSGDPSVFGRLGEEIEELRRARIPFEIVPGVTAVTAAAAAASAALTDRRRASALVILTGHRCAQADPRSLLPGPARATYAVYMPGSDYGSTAGELMRSGIGGDTPCALVSKAGRPGQQVFRLRLAQLHSRKPVPAPAILIVGEVTAELPAEITAAETSAQAGIYEDVLSPPVPSPLSL